LDTRPTIETVLERINALGERLSAEFNGRIDSLAEDFANRIDLFKEYFDGRINNLQQPVEAIRTTLDEHRTALWDIKRKIEVLNNNFLQIQADQNELRRRVENLESKPS
jgi:chromosome segregation ATPase